MPNSACNNTNGPYFTDGRSHGFSPTAWDRLKPRCSLFVSACLTSRLKNQ
jgi:hypothetical protein